MNTQTQVQQKSRVVKHGLKPLRNAAKHGSVSVLGSLSCSIVIGSLDKGFYCPVNKTEKLQQMDSKMWEAWTHVKVQRGVVGDSKSSSWLKSFWRRQCASCRETEQASQPQLDAWWQEREAGLEGASSLTFSWKAHLLWRFLFVVQVMLILPLLLTIWTIASGLFRFRGNVI